MIHAEVFGQSASKEAPTVVLIHGQPGSAADWIGVIPALADRFRLVIVDRPGWGRTGGRAVGFVANATEVIAVLDSIGADGAVFVGHSWGGAVALAAAERYPAYVAGLVLVASVHPGGSLTRMDRVLASWPAGPAIAELSFGVGNRVMRSRPTRRFVNPNLRGPLRFAIDSLAAEPARRSGRNFAIEQRALVKELPSLAPRLGDITVPAAVLVGTADRVVPPSDGADLARDLPAGWLITVAGAGHLLPHDEPAEVAAAIATVAGMAAVNTPGRGPGDDGPVANGGEQS